MSCALAQALAYMRTPVPYASARRSTHQHFMGALRVLLTNVALRGMLVPLIVMPPPITFADLASFSPLSRELELKTVTLMPIAEDCIPKSDLKI